MRAKHGLLLAALFGMFASGESVAPLFDKPKEKVQDFTDEELALVRSLPKKERKALVNELRRKYAKKD